MKELSIEEKARRYDEAIKRAKDALKDGTISSNTIAYLQDIFPELAESEDERIRKRIIALVNAHGQGMYKDKMLAWLEKQDEQKPNYCHHEVDFSCCSDEYRKAYYDGWNNCNQQHAQLKAEQKPTEWSEDDKKYYDGIIKSLSYLYDITKDEDVKQNLQLKMIWLKSIKNRVLQQPNQEWSEEDEKMWKDVLSIVEGSVHPRFYDKVVDWLKSLKPQIVNITDEDLSQAKKSAFNDALDKIEYHSGEPTFDDGWSAAIDFVRKKSIKWKPSDEQLQALESAYHSHLFGDTAAQSKAPILESLLKELKKL